MRRRAIRVYVAGPMSKGDLMVNVRAALDAAHRLRDLGFFPYLPQLCVLWHLAHPREYEDWMVQDLEWLSACDAVLRLPGESSGADREVVYAVERGIHVFPGVDDLVHFVEAFDGQP